MTAEQESDCMALLAQRASVKEVAAWVGVSEWAVARLFRPCRRAPRTRSARPPAQAEA